MKTLLLPLFVILGSLMSSGILYSQTDPFAEIAPQKIFTGDIDKNPNANATPIPSDDMFDLIFEYPCAIGGGEAGIETDGIFIYTTKWNGNQFYKYEIDGTFIDSLTIPGVSNIRDLAYNGTYFFGGAASYTVYELDFENATLISAFTAPTDVRAIAYNDYDDAFYANNWGSDIVKFNYSGQLLGSFPVGPVGDSYYGFAYDNFTSTQYLWGYAQVGNTQNELIAMALPDGYETGVYFDVGSVSSISDGIAGGLCIEHICYDIAIIGLSQNDFIWGLELCALGCLPDNDIGINSILEPSSGIGYTSNDSVTIRIENYGWNPQSDFIVSFSHNGSTLYFDTVFSTINFGETYDFTFDTTIDMSMGGTHNIEACTHLIGDECVINDCKYKVIDVINLNADILIIDLDESQIGSDLMVILENLLPDLDISIANSLEGYAIPEQVQTIFLLLGVYPNNHYLADTEAEIITTWIDSYDNRNLYMEGGDTWVYDQSTTLHGYFNINPLEDGTGDLFTINGIGSYWNGMTWIYTGENNYIDHIEAIPPAINVLHNTEEEYITGVAYDAVTYKTVGASHQIMGLTGISGTQIAVSNVLAWFGYPFYSYGDLEGYLTDCLTGEPIENGEISIGWFFTTTAPDGYFIFENILAGTWELYYSAPGYCLPEEQLMVTIVEGQTTTIDNLCLFPAQFEVDPETIYIELEPNAQTQEIVTLSNPGNCEIEWNATTVFNNENGTDAMFDLIWDVPVGVGGGEAGIETNGTYIYTTKWNGTGEYYRYGMDGTYIEELLIPDAVGTRDMAFNGTYFYGGAASTTVFELDLDNADLISTFTAPTDCRAIAYNDDDNTFYANNWGSDITKFDMTGANLGSFPVGPVGDSYYGFAYNNSEGTPYLWGYAQVGATMNELVQIELPSGTETGLTFDVGSVAAVGAGIAGGMAIDDHIVAGLWAFLGTSQNVNLWALELGPASPVWLTIDPASGTLVSGATEEMGLFLNANDLLPGYYFAEIQFATSPFLDVPNVDVTLYVVGVMPPINLSVSYSCTDIGLSWEVPPPAQPDSFYVYRNDTLIAVVPTDFIDTMVMPEIEYGYYVLALYNGNPSPPSPTIYITVPTPSDLEPLDLEAIIHYPNENDVTLLWEEPIACLSPDGYNIFRNDEQINSTLVIEPTYIDPDLPGNFYEYYVTAVYYFGESIPSDPTYALLYDIDEFNFEICRIYPNPSEGLLNIESGYPIRLVKIFDIHGKHLLSNKINQKKTQIDVSQLEPGFYFIQLEIEDKTVLRKIVVQ